MNKPSAALVAQYVIKDGLKELVLLPVWWYTTGLGCTLGWMIRSMKGSVRFFELNIWVKNVFVPMYGEEGFSGRLISFGVRLAVIVFKTIGVAVLCFVISLLTLLYVFAIPLILIGLIGNILGLL